MAEVENLVLEQLRLIRETRGKMDERLNRVSEKVDDLARELWGHSGLLIALAGYVKSIDGRVGHLAHGLEGPAA